MITSDKSLDQRVSDLEASTKNADRYERLIKALTLLGAVVTFAWALYQHFDATRNEFRKVFWEKRYVLYSRACSAAAKIATASDLNGVANQRSEFWLLYWGELSIVENEAVRNAMVDFGVELSGLEQQLIAAGQQEVRPTNKLKQLSYYLARASRNSLKATWEPVPLDDLTPRPVETTKSVESQ